jgi:hypothetical protein
MQDTPFVILFAGATVLILASARLGLQDRPTSGKPPGKRSIRPISAN